MDRVSLFKDLSTNEFQAYDVAKQESLLGEYYDAFSGFCEFIKNETSPEGHFEGNVQSVSCDIQDDGVHFSATLKSGESKEIFFSKNGK